MTLRFSIRELLLGITIIALSIGWWLDNRRHTANTEYWKNELTQHFVETKLLHEYVIHSLYLANTQQGEREQRQLLSDTLKGSEVNLADQMEQLKEVLMK